MVTWLRNGFLVIESPYNPDFVKDIRLIPYQSRKWNPDDKTWTVSKEHADFAYDLCVHYFENVEEERE